MPMPSAQEIPDRLTETVIKELLDLLKDYGIPEKDRVEAARQIVNLMRNVMSATDALRLTEILRKK